MRLTSDFWVSALIRRVQGLGGFAYLARRGSTEAGAIFIKHRARTGSFALYGPAPQTAYDESTPDERAFVCSAHDVTDALCETQLAKELRFDPDLWLVEIEDVDDLPALIKVMPETDL